MDEQVPLYMLKILASIWLITFVLAFVKEQIDDMMDMGIFLKILFSALMAFGITFVALVIWYMLVILFR